MARPILDEKISVQDFKDFYWLKEELLTFCKNIGIQRNGGKIDLENRITHFLTTGQKIKESANKQIHSSKFDWNTEILTPNTIITDSYKNSENVRAYFSKEIGDHFSFNIKFMDWMKNNIGKTLNDASIEWKRLHLLKKDKNHKSDIAPQFQYNRYIRDFLMDNPHLSTKDATRHWNIKSTIRGDKSYSKEDLKFTLK